MVRERPDPFGEFRYTICRFQFNWLSIISMVGIYIHPNLFIHTLCRKTVYFARILARPLKVCRVSLGEEGGYDIDMEICKALG